MQYTRLNNYSSAGLDNEHFRLHLHGSSDGGDRYVGHIIVHVSTRVVCSRPFEVCYIIAKFSLPITLRQAQNSRHLNQT